MSAGSPGWPEGVRELEHTGDVAIEVAGPTFAALLDRAALALRRLSVAGDGEAGGNENGEPPVERVVELEATDEAALLVRWLQEMLYRIDAEGHAYRSARIDLDPTRPHLRAVVLEDRLPACGARVKSVTYHGLSCESDRDGWKARVIFDV